MTYHVQKMTGIVDGQYGDAIAISVLDEDGNAADLSAYTVVILRAISEDNQTTRQITGALVSASGGTLTVTPDTATYFNSAGDWDSQLQFSDTGKLALTVPFIIEVSKQI